MSMGDPPNWWVGNVLDPQMGATNKAYVDSMNSSLMYPKVTSFAETVTIEDDTGANIGTVSHAELVKYIRERTLVETNETVRSLWERYQVAIRLVGREEDGSADQ